MAIVFGQSVILLTHFGIDDCVAHEITGFVRDNSCNNNFGSVCGKCIKNSCNNGLVRFGSIVE